MQMAVYLHRIMLRRIFSFLPALALLLPAPGSDGLPVMQRSALKKELLWELETALTGHREQNGAVMECTASTLTRLLQSCGREATVLSVVQVLTSPSEPGSPESSIKQLLLAGDGRLLVSDDATFAVLHVPTRSGETLEIIRDTAMGLSVHRLQR